MAETVGPQLEGSIELNIKEFRAGVSELTKSVTTISKTFDRLNKSIGSMQKQLNNTSKSYRNTSKAAKQAGDTQAKSAKKAADLEQKKANAITRAVNKINTMEQTVKKSSATHSQQSAVISRLRKGLQQYSESVNRGKMSTVEMDNANTKLSTTIGSATRQLKEYSKSTKQSERQQVANMRAMNEADVSYRRAAAAINQSEMSTEQKDAALKNLNKSLVNVRKQLDRYGTGTKKAVGAQNQFKKATAEANIQARSANKQFRKKSMESWRAQMSDLTSSVQLALGPLSGIASRIQALTALFNRNAVAIAGLFASMTGITVAFGKAIKSGIEAERQLRSLEGVVAGLGDSAGVTGQELFDMGTRIGAGLLTSAKEARTAAGTIASFGSISKSQFEEVITAAQGLTETMGGNLQQNTKKLGRLLDDPVENFTSLREAGVSFSDETEELVTQLRAQGRVFEANEVLLERFSFATEAAKSSSDSLAGALDTAGENLNRFFEMMFTESGAAEVAREQVQRFTEVVAEMTSSGAAKEFGESLATVLNIAGNAINLIVENLKTFKNLLVGAVIYSIVQFIGKMLAKIGVTKASTKALYSHAKAQGVAAAATRAHRTAIVTTTKATRALTAALARTPFGAIAIAISSIGAAWLMASDDVKKWGEDLDKTLSDAEDKIKNMEGLSQEQQQEFTELLPDTDAIEEETQKTIEKLKKRKESVEKEMKGSPLGGAFDGEAIQESRNQVNLLNDRIEILEGSLKGASSQMDATVESASRMSEEILRSTAATGTVIDDVKELREEFLKDEVALENLQDKIKAAETQLETLTQAAADGDEKAGKWAKTLREVVKAMEEQEEELKNSSEGSGKLSRAYQTLTKSLSEMRGEYVLASSTLRDDAFQRLKEQINMDKEMDNLRQQLSRLSGTEYKKLAESIDLNISKLGSEKEIQKAVTQAYINKASALRQEINAQNALRQAREAAIGIEEGGMSGIQQAEKEQQDNMRDIQELGRSLSLEDQQRYQKAALQARKDYLQQVESIERRASELTRFTPLSEVEQLEKDLQRRREALKDHYDTESSEYQNHLKQMEDNAARQKTWLQVGDAAETGADMVGQAMEAMTAAGRENTKEMQHLKIAQALMNQASAVADVWGGDGPWYEKVAKSALAGAQVGAQVQQIRSQSYAQGGEVSGKGTSTSDDVPAMLSAGEFVMRASAVRKFGMDTLNRMNEGKMPKMREGGAVIAPSMNSNKEGGSKPVQFIVNNYAEGVEVEQEERVDEDGNKQLIATVNNVVKKGLMTGEFDTPLSQFGNSSGTIRRQGRGR